MFKKLSHYLVVQIYLILFFFQFASAQAPSKISYQAVIRNSSNILVSNAPVGMKISILQFSPNGASVYAETHNPTSNENGLISIEIGGGTLVSGNFSAIDWSSGSYFLQTETDPNGGSNYTITGTSQLLSVPFSLYSNKSGDTKKLKTLIYTGF